MRTYFLSMALCGVVALAGCESGGLRKNKADTPPVTLLEDEEQAAAGGTSTSTSLDIPPAEGAPAPAVQQGLSLSSNQRFGDIPLPQGLTTDTARTFVYESSTLTLGRMVYTTKSPVNEVAQFFLNQCPLSGWTRMNLIEADGIDMLFTKPGKKLEISIREASRTQTQLVVNLTPEGGITRNQ
jgi:hypothetical protein